MERQAEREKVMRAVSLLYHDVVKRGESDASGFPGLHAGRYKLDGEEFEGHMAALHAAVALPPRTVLDVLAQDAGSPFMLTFDAAGRETCVVRETRTNTPLQALNLMNDVSFLEASRFVAQRMMKQGGASAAARLGYGFRLVTGRAPSTAEQRALLDSLAAEGVRGSDDSRRRVRWPPTSQGNPYVAINGRMPRS